MAEGKVERVHGGIDAARARALGVDPARVVDFSVNLNPYGPCLPVLQAARGAELARYPDMHAHAAREAWAESWGCGADELAVGHGAADLMWAIARAFLRPGARALIAEPTFSEFGLAARAAGASVEEVRSVPFDLEALARAGRGADTLYLCSPNNPTGEYVDSARVSWLAAQLPTTKVVLDQSFLGLSDHAEAARDVLPPNVLRVRSLTKEFACPGLRIAVCRAATDLIAQVEAQRPTWATSSPAQAALVAAAGQGAFVRASYQKMRADREALRALLRARGYAPLPSETTYQLVEVGDAARFTEAALRHGVMVRDCSSFGLPRHVRIAALPAHARLAAVLDAVQPSR